MKLESASRQVDFEKAVGAFGNAEPEFRFSGFSLFRPSTNPKVASFSVHFCEHSLKSLRIQVAQSVEQRTENPCVGGSIPPLSTPPHSESPFIYFEFVCRRFDGVYPAESVAPVQWNKKNLRLFFFPLPSHSTLI